MTAQLRRALTANDLIEGDVIYLDRKGTWTRALAEAALAEDDASAAQLEAAGAAAVDAQLIVEPYLIDIHLKGGAVVPVRYREQLRALGPSTRLDLGKQAGEPPRDD
jgi:hypothetical protein